METKTLTEVTYTKKNRLGETIEKTMSATLETIVYGHNVYTKEDGNVLVLNNDNHATIDSPCAKFLYVPDDAKHCIVTENNMGTRNYLMVENGKVIPIRGQGSKHSPHLGRDERKE